MELRYYVGLFIVTIIIYIVNDQQWARQIESELPLDSVVLINDVVDEKGTEQDEHTLDDDDAKLLDFITKHWPVGTMKYRQFNTSIWYTTGEKPVVQNYTYEETHRIDEQWTRLNKRVDHALDACATLDYAVDADNKHLIDYLPGLPEATCKDLSQQKRTFGKNEALAARWCRWTRHPCYYHYYTHGLSLNAYFKTGTQMLTNIALAMYNVDYTVLKANPKEVKLKTQVYSGRSAYQTVRDTLPGTPIGPSYAELAKLTTDGISGLVTRHPIVRIISSWHDKFGYNSTKGSGFKYGYKKLLTMPWSTFFRAEAKWVHQLSPTLLKEHFKFDAMTMKRVKVLFGQDGTGQFPRENTRDPWHCIDFERMVDFIVTRTTDNHTADKRKAYVADGHWRPYYTQGAVSPCKTKYDFIIKQENFGDEFGYLADKLKMPLPDDLDPRKHFFHSNGPTNGNNKLEAIKSEFKSYWDRIDIAKRKIIYEIYEPDLIMFDYGWNYETNEIMFNI